jgi:small GTP-binding protein
MGPRESYLAVSARGKAELWDIASGARRAAFDLTSVSDVAIVPSASRRCVLALAPENLTVFNLEQSAILHRLSAPGLDPARPVALTGDGARLVYADKEGKLTVKDIGSGGRLALFELGSTDITAVAVDDPGRYLVTGSADGTVRLCDLKSERCIVTMEGHVGPVTCLAITPDGRSAISGSADRTIRVWRLPTGVCLATLKGSSTGPVTKVAVGRSGLRGIYRTTDNRVSLWDVSDLQTDQGTSDAMRYTNAKVLLVGDSGVGKSSLAIRLTSGDFALTASTHGAWATQLKLKGTTVDGVEREVWLWDFGGQSDYRLVHQLYFDETALAILVFNPQSDNPFDALGQWDRDLVRAAKRPFQKLLVAGRCDRGGLLVSGKAIEEFRDARGFSAFLSTSALTGMGCGELRDAIEQHIRWDAIPWTSSPRLFKRLKDAIVELKDLSLLPDRPILLRLPELKQQVQVLLPGEPFTVEELEAVLGLLSGPGIVWRLSFGDFILLQPERINAYAGALIRTVRSHVDEIGVIREDDVLSANLDFQDMDRLPISEEQIVLRAMHQTFIDRSMCLREHTDRGTVLVFPSHFRRERPELVDHPAPVVTYSFSGNLEEVYASLVVRLHYTAAFERDQLWRFAADFRTPGKKRAGFKMVNCGEGKGEITVYFERGTPDDTEVTFIRYVHDHLLSRSHDVVRSRHYVCPSCGTPVENRLAVQKRLSRGQPDIPCSDCEKRVPLVDLIETKFASEEIANRTRQLARDAAKAIDNESRELILLGHAFAVSGEAGQIFRPTPNSDWGIDGEIEFKDGRGRASGRRVYLQLKSGDSYLRTRKSDGVEVFAIKEQRHAEYWQKQAYPVMLVIRTSDGVIRWMDVSAYLKAKQSEKVRQIVFEGVPFDAFGVLRLREEVMATIDQK